MSGDSMYNYKPAPGSDREFVIENGILKGDAVKSNYISDYQPRSFGELLLKQLRDNPKFIGQVDGVTGREETFGEMAGKSVKCAMWMKKQNIKPGDIIAICTNNRTDMYVPCFASLYLGAVYNPWWDTGITKELAKHFLNLTKPKVLFTNEISASVAIQAATEIGMEIKVVILGKISGHWSLEDILMNQDDKFVSEFRCTKLSSIDDPAIIVYTSGTTGLPKGALHSNRSLFENVSNTGYMMDKIDANDGGMRTMFFSPLAWSTGVLFMLRAILLHETRILYPEFIEEKALELIDKYKVNWLFMSPSAAMRLQQSSSSARDYDLTSLKYIWLGGTVMKEEAQEAIAGVFPTANIRQCYGTTELGGVSLLQSTDGKYGSCGTVVINMMLKVIDTMSGHILGPNQTGEACFKSSFMMTSYYDNPKATEEIIDAEGWLHSGDLVHYDQEGNVFVTNRIKEMIKYRTNHVSPAMVEQVLLQHPEVIEAAVLGIPNKIDDEHPMAFVATTPNPKVTKEELENLVAAVLPDYMRLRGGVEFINEMPHTPSGKISRSDLRKLI